MTTTKTTVRLPDELIKEIRHLAIDEDKNFQEILAEAISFYLQTKKQQKATALPSLPF